ncbi:hypothetical protein [Actinacidiphila sp. ITFR-21]|uniref:hypothetical protein n=1 Tax=Actinacidiphila sp. ITFR-21 TaxID=3075199 RepID=UPI00288B063B|nr:hypothetical protein [Streptomyces sp. ITFR-21]WNI20201.1 hypothetical protein RLT57_32195 [Streptomyces sp. ITFR-21]
MQSEQPEGDAQVHTAPPTVTGAEPAHPAAQDEVVPIDVAEEPDHPAPEEVVLTLF